MDQDKAPIVDALADYHAQRRYGFTPPSHRLGRGIDKRVLDVMGLDPFRSDVLATGGLDDRKSSHGYLERAQELMAEAVGAEQAFFSTCGSSLSVKACILAATAGGGELLISRDAHKSAVAGLMLAGIQPRWIRPRWDPKLHLAHPPSPDAVEATWERYPDASAALIVSPTPYGTSAEIEAIADVCHQRGKPLIVDEAWGAYLPFHDDLPTWAMSAGADLCVVSIHKAGMGFEQGSVYHLQGDLIDPSRLMQCADLLSTTSPNVLIYAAIDGWRRQMVQHGTELVAEALGLARQVRQRIEELPGLHVLEDELIGAEASHDLDRLHILTDVTDLGISGYQAADWLRENCRLDVSTNDSKRFEVMISQADDTDTVDRLLDALAELVSRAPAELPTPPQVRMPEPGELELETADLPRDAFFHQVEDVPAEEAVGRVAAEQITPYPPGIPVVLPGEIINQAVVDYLRSGLDAGMVLPDPKDPSLQTIRVVSFR
jgi:arginine/lysine/ornithine decarboxylase